MPRNGNGNYALPNSVNPVVGGTPATAEWANITLSDIQNELTQSLERNGKGAMLASLRIAAGTAAVPGLAFAAETDSGLYRAGAGDLRVAVAGTDRLTLTATQLTIAAALAVTGQIKGPDGTITAPGLSFSSEAGAGLYRAGSNDVRLAINSKDIAKATTKLSVSAATNASGGTRQDALSLTNGDLDMSGVTYPTSTTAISNRLTPANICKAWVVFQIVGGGGSNFTVTVQAAFNITSVAWTSSTTFTITFASAFSSATSYGPVGQVLNGLIAGGDQLLFNPTTRNTGSLVGGVTASKTGGAVNLNSSSDTFQMMVVFFGAQ